VRKWLRAHWSRLTAGLALAVVAGVTGRISYTHIYELTLALGQPEMVARLYPFGVDGLIVVGSVVLLQATPDHPCLGWLGVAPGIAASVFANVESGLGHGWLAAAWAGVPAAFFAAATFMLERWLKSQVSRAAPSTAEALRVLLSSASQRQLEKALGVPRSRIQAWASQVAGESPEDGQEADSDAAA
jgi:hypothetical protein